VLARPVALPTAVVFVSYAQGEELVSLTLRYFLRVRAGLDAFQLIAHRIKTDLVFRVGVQHEVRDNATSTARLHPRRDLAIPHKESA
jgi:hypothetical protein